MISCLMPSTTWVILPRMSAEAELTEAGIGGRVVLMTSTLFVRDSIAVERSCWTVWASSLRSFRVTSTNSFMSFFPRSINLLKDAPQADDAPQEDQEDLEEATGAVSEGLTAGAASSSEDVVGAEAMSALSAVVLVVLVVVAPVRKVGGVALSSGLMNW